MATVDQYKGSAQVGAAREVVLEKALPFFDHCERRIGVAIPGQIDQIAHLAQFEEINLLGAPGGIGGAGQTFAIGQRID